MAVPTPEVAARAFGLGHPVGDLALVRRGDTDTWRLDTAKGSYLIKGYRSTTDGQFVAGGLQDQLEVAMAFERRALHAGVDMAEPIPPIDPLVGWVTRINERLFRAYRWIEHRPLGSGDDISDWLGRTMARVHQIEPLGRAALPDWWRAVIWPRTTWEEWFAEAQNRNRAWSDLAQDRLPSILDVSARIEALCQAVPDRVTTHGDFKTHNMLLTQAGPVLVDWDSVRVDSAALEAGRVAFIFGAGELEPIRRILRAYAAAGGDIGWAGQDLFLSVARHDLTGLFARILVSLGRTPPARWMGDSQETEHNIWSVLRDFPSRIAHLDNLASKVTGIAPGRSAILPP